VPGDPGGQTRTSFSPRSWKRYRLHPDHRHAGFLAVEGIVAAGNPHFFPSRASPRTADLPPLWEADEVDHVEAIDGSVGAKLTALLAHRSQWVSTMGIDADRGRRGAGVREPRPQAGRPRPARRAVCRSAKLQSDRRL